MRLLYQLIKKVFVHNVDKFLDNPHFFFSERKKKRTSSFFFFEGVYFSSTEGRGCPLSFNGFVNKKSLCYPQPHTGKLLAFFLLFIYNV